MSAATLANLIIKIVIMMALGFALRKGRVFDDAFQVKLSWMLVNVIMPAKILAVGNSPYNASQAGNLLLTGIISVAYYVLANLLMQLVSRPLPIEQANKGQFVNLAAYSNNSFIGFPIIAQIYGAEGSLYNVINTMVQNLFCYTLGIKTLVGKGGGIKSVLRNPVSWISLGSILLFISPLRLPIAIVDTANLIGDMSAPFSMFIIGASLATLKPSTLLTSGSAWLINLFRMVVFPLGTGFILWAVGLRGVMPATCVVLLGLPPATVNVVFAEQFGKDIPFATRAAVQGTALMVITLPLLTLFTQALFF
ncbi:MAG: hypothetical protein GXY32_07555 [Ruminococcaceae bacterium]|nr:hypothetical protein [Oscillospiraceae bacterium]